jgi:poly(ADP-ribose) glycohydrolase
MKICALGPCATQEGLLFSLYPECFAGILFCETMQPDEAIQIGNVRPYCTSTGFQDTFRVTGQAEATESLKTILAMDASIAFSSRNDISDQCTGYNRDHDIAKAYTAFSSVMCGECAANASGTIPIATGKWGYGAFGGNLYCKFLVQLIAASLCGGVSLTYWLLGGA